MQALSLISDGLYRTISTASPSIGAPTTSVIIVFFHLENDKKRTPITGYGAALTTATT
jgi:hypothetical protein